MEKHWDCKRLPSSHIQFASNKQNCPECGALYERDMWRKIAVGLYSHPFVCHETHERCAVDEYEEAMEAEAHGKDKVAEIVNMILDATNGEAW